MLTGSTVFAASLGYVGLLFFIAWWGDREGPRFLTGGRRTLVYALSLAVYCTSWTYYGSVGLASARGLDFLPIYIGPILVVGFGHRFVKRIARLAREQNLTTVADFVSARYGKSQIVAALAALIALMASAPYIALQLKAITQTILMVLGSFEHGRLTPGSPSPLFSLAVAALLALFAMAFGTRRINPTEHQQGLILAIAVESVVKLVAFLARRRLRRLGPVRRPRRALRRSRTTRASRRCSARRPIPPTGSSRRCCRRARSCCCRASFTSPIVENGDKRDIRAAASLFPVYLVADQSFRRAARDRGADAVSRRRDRPRPDRARAAACSAGARGLALMTMIGGLSAATGMVVVDSVALAITVSNDLVMPILLRRRGGPGRGGGRRDRRAGADGAAPRDPVRAGDRLSLRAPRQRRRRSPRSACSRSPRSRRSRRRFWAALVWRRGTARGAAAGMIVGLARLALSAVPALARPPRARSPICSTPGRSASPGCGPPRWWRFRPIRWSAASSLSLGANIARLRRCSR